MKRFFHIYQYLGPVLLTPLAGYFWWRHYQGNWHLAGIALAVPILHAYIVPGIGTNVLGMWSFNTKLKLGRFRPHHGFVFGGATSILVLPVVVATNTASGAASIVSTAIAVGLLLLVVNWIYDALALKHGYLEVYNQPWADGSSPWAVAGDYVPWFFGVFGLIYGAGLRVAEHVLSTEPSISSAILVGGSILAATITIPTIGYIATSWIRHGHSGLKPFDGRLMEASKQ